MILRGSLVPMLSPRLGLPRVGIGWGLVVAGQFVAVFATLALSGPGRIDIVDGQTRYEVARSLVEHGDSIIRDPDVRYTVFPGRDGRLYTPYRFPQTGAGVVAIVLADHTGPVSEGRRHFAFALTSAFAGALLAVIYTLWFRSAGMGCLPAVAWGSAGIFCTPNWFYATSTFDDILGTAAVVGAFALGGASRRGWLWAPAAGLALGLAFNCKQPLGLFVLPVLAVAYDGKAPLSRQWARLGTILAGLAAGVIAYKAYDYYKYPPEALLTYADAWADRGPLWNTNPLPALLSLSVSVGAGAFWYCPTWPLTLRGLAAEYRHDRRVSLAALAASAGFVLFLSFVAYYKGDPAWGPRYLTPMLALWWLWAPAGAARLGRRLTVLLLSLGAAVQLLGLSVDPQRLHLERGLPCAAYSQPGWLHFKPAYSHLLNRPREIGEILAAGHGRAGAYTPAPSPTFATPGISSRIQEAVWDYHVFASLRPWWVQQYLSPEERPVDLSRTVLFLLTAASGGLALMLLGRRLLAGPNASYASGGEPIGRIGNACDNTC
jgi:hypothetical protein